MHIYIYIFRNTFISLYICMHTYGSKYIYIYIYIYIHLITHTHTHTHTSVNFCAQKYVLVDIIYVSDKQTISHYS